jgi:hypothetical protein
MFILKNFAKKIAICNPTVEITPIQKLNYGIGKFLYFVILFHLFWYDGFINVFSFPYNYHFRFSASDSKEKIINDFIREWLRVSHKTLIYATNDYYFLILIVGFSLYWTILFAEHCYDEYIKYKNESIKNKTKKEE